MLQQILFWMSGNYIKLIATKGLLFSTLIVKRNIRTLNVELVIPFIYIIFIKVFGCNVYLNALHIEQRRTLNTITRNKKFNSSFLILIEYLRILKTL
ncbi:MAG: hypothetical protein MI739_11795 [Bacteroidales bacterium]|nr:hypothetical protein [Bacteroidales bacterium]